MTQSTSPERPLRRDAERNRLRILQAAGELFAERGLGVTLDDVAHHAGVGVGTVYRRFPDKDVLIEALFEQRIDDLCALADEALALADPWDALVWFFEGALERQAADRGLKELLMCSAHGRAGVKLGREHLRARVNTLFERAHAAGVLRDDVSAHDGPLLQMMVGAIIDRAQDVEPEIWRRYLVLLLDGLRPARAAASPLPAPALGDAALDTVMARTGRPRPRAAGC